MNEHQQIIRIAGHVVAAFLAFFAAACLSGLFILNLDVEHSRRAIIFFLLASFGTMATAMVSRLMIRWAS